MRWFRKLVLVGVFVSWAPVSAEAAEAVLTWEYAEPDPSITGWKIYYDSDQPGPPYDGTEANEGPSPIDVPIATLADPSMPTVTLTGFESCKVYWFAATAYNDAGESDFSGEVEKKLVAKPRDVTAVSEAVGEVHLSWNGPPDDDPGMIPSYQISYDWDGPGEPYTAAGSPLSISGVTEIVLSNLTTNATYYFVVDSICDNFATKRSDEVSVRVISELPDMGSTPGPVIPTQPDPVSGADMGTDADTYVGAADEGCACTTGAPRTSGAWSMLALLGVAAAGFRRSGRRR